jgi:hypothetical protein
MTVERKFNLLSYKKEQRNEFQESINQTKIKIEIGQVQRIGLNNHSKMHFKNKNKEAYRS